MGNTFVITGSGRDIGAAIARRLVRPNAFGVLHCHASRIGAEAVPAELQAAGGDGVVLDADLTRDEELPRFVANLGAALGELRIDTLLRNAAYTAASSIGVGSSDDLRRMIVAKILAPQLIVDGLHARIADGGFIIALSIAAVRQVFSPEFGFSPRAKPRWTHSFGPGPSRWDPAASAPTRSRPASSTPMSAARCSRTTRSAPGCRTRPRSVGLGGWTTSPTSPPFSPRPPRGGSPAK